MNKTVFITDDANYFYKVMSFGLKNAGATYKRLMDKVFSHLMGKCVEVYVDDMVVKSPSHHQHAQDLSAVFSALKQYSLRLNPDKCIFDVNHGKFLGFMLTQRSIEANPEKCNAIIEMRSSTSIKEVQRLIGCLTAISRFLSKLSEQTQSIIQLLKKSAKFTWNDDCEQIFQKLKAILTSPPNLHKPDTHQSLLVYITSTDHTVNAVLVQDIGGTQHPIHFVSRTLQDPETRYQMVGKLALSLVQQPAAYAHTSKITTSSPKLITQYRRYCKNQTLWDECRLGPLSCPSSTSVTNLMAPSKLDASWTLYIRYDLQQTLAEDQWTLYVDGSSNPKGAGVDIVLEGPNDILIEKSLHFAFRTSNNQAEYEAILAVLSLVREVGVKSLTCKMDSKLTVGLQMYPSISNKRVSIQPSIRRRRHDTCRNWRTIPTLGTI